MSSLQVKFSDGFETVKVGIHLKGTLRVFLSSSPLIQPSDLNFLMSTPQGVGDGTTNAHSSAAKASDMTEQKCLSRI